MDENFFRSSFTLTKACWSPFLQVCLLLFGAFVSYAIAYINGNVSIYLPFLSETGAKVPELNVFSLFCMMGSFVGIVVVFYRYLVLKFLLRNAHRKLHELNNTACMIGIVAWLGLAGVAAFPMSTVFWAHLLVACIHFIASMVYIFLQTFINYNIPGSSIFLNRVRLAICLVLLLFIFLLVIFFPLSLLKWNKTNVHAPSLKKPTDPVFGLIFASSFFEWATYGTLLVYISSFFYEFRNFELVSGVIPIPPKEVSTDAPPNIKEGSSSEVPLQVTQVSH